MQKISIISYDCMWIYNCVKKKIPTEIKIKEIMKEISNYYPTTLK